MTFVSFLIANFSNDYKYTFYSFLVYEVSVGMLYPTYSKIKSEFLPSNNRGTLMNIFKIPLNLVVIFTLLSMNSLFSLNQLLIINLSLAFIVLLLQSIFFYKKDEQKLSLIGAPQLTRTKHN